MTTHFVDVFFGTPLNRSATNFSIQDAVASDARLDVSSAVSSDVLVLDVAPFSLLVLLLEAHFGVSTRTRWNQAAVYLVQEVTCCSLCFTCCVHHSLFACQSC